MRHYLGYTVTGVIRYIAFGPLPVACDPNTPGSDDTADHLIAEAARDWPDVIGWLEYNCACADDQFGTCQCPQARTQDSNVDISGAPVMATLPTASWKLDGVAKAVNTREAPEVLTPGATVAGKLVVALPDTTELSLEAIPGMGAILADGLPATLTITSGESDAVNLTVPPAGITGGVRVHTEGVHTIAGMFIRGSLS